MTYRWHLGCILPKVPAISLDVVDRAPDINRDSKGQCLPVFDTPSMGYMDKTIFWRNRVMGGAGVKLEPCRADCLNMWIECEFDSADAGITLVNGKGDW